MNGSLKLAKENYKCQIKKQSSRAFLIEDKFLNDDQTIKVEKVFLPETSSL